MWWKTDDIYRTTSSRVPHGRSWSLVTSCLTPVGYFVPHKRRVEIPLQERRRHYAWRLTTKRGLSKPPEWDFHLPAQVTLHALQHHMASFTRRLKLLEQNRLVWKLKIKTTTFFSFVYSADQSTAANLRGNKKFLKSTWLLSLRQAASWTPIKTRASLSNEVKSMCSGETCRSCPFLWLLLQ